jgi:hypothetical protein
MMFVLVRNLPPQQIDMAWTHGKCPVAVLPVEVGQVDCLGLYPLRRISLQLLDEVGDGNRAPESAKNMHVVDDAADAKDRAVEIFAGTAEVFMHFVADGWVLKKGPAVFRREDYVKVDLGKGLRHGVFLDETPSG